MHLEHSNIKIKSFGNERDRHLKKYIIPYTFGNTCYNVSGTHVLANTNIVSLNYHKISEEDQHSYVSAYDVTDSHDSFFRTSLLYKPFKPNNSGFSAESQFAKYLFDNGAMNTISSAGCSAGHDFTFFGFPGEYKLDLSAAFGQITVTRNKKGLWCIPVKNRAKRPKFCEEIEKTNLIDILNEKQPVGYVPEENRSRATDIYSEALDLSPLLAYLEDHHVEILHVDSHGTYLLNEISGSGKFRIREKHSPHSRTIQFSVLSLEKSDIHISNPESIEKFYENIIRIRS